MITLLGHVFTMYVSDHPFQNCEIQFHTPSCTIWNPTVIFYDKFNDSVDGWHDCKGRTTYQHEIWRSLTHNAGAC